MQLYRGSRYGLYSDFSYEIPATNGTYELTLKFSENNYWGPGYRVFHVDANGTRILSNFDIAAAAGGARTAVDRKFTLNVTTGKVRLDFIGVTQRAMVSGIELVQTSSSSGGSGSSSNNGSGNGSNPPAASVAVAVTPGSVNLGPNGQATFAATVTGATDTRVTWSLVGNAPQGTITSAGVYTAPSSLTQNNQITVKATSVADSSKSATATVNLQSPVNISVSPATTSVIAGNTVQFTASVTGTSATGVSWTASAGSISANGLFTSPSVTQATQVTITARSTSDTTKVATATVTVNPVATSTGTGAWIETGGLVTMEAEKGRILNTSQSWLFRTNVTGYVGTGFLSVEPNNNVNASENYTSWAPQVQFDVRFSRAGTYYIWVRGYGETDSDDSINFGLNGARVATAETLSEFPLSPSAWGWSNDAMDRVRRVTLVVPSAGLHTINAWMREDGFRFDRLLLTTDANYRPSGAGPAESSRETGGTSPVLSLTTTAVPFTATVGATPAPQAVGIANTGSGTMSWTASSNQSWLTVSPTSGTGNGSINLSVNVAGLAAGTRTAAVTVSAPGATSGTQTVTVTLNLTAAPVVTTPTLSLNPSSLSMNGSAGGGTVSQTASLSFSGGSASWSASSDQSWLSVSPASGSGAATLNLTATPGSRAAGAYTAKITVLAAGATNSPAVINVTLNLAAAPPVSSSGRSFYVAPNGSPSGDGSINKPWDFTSAMKNTSAIKAGDTVWVRGGTYGTTGKEEVQARLLGTATAPIIIRAYPGENAKIQHPMIIGCCDQSANPSMGAHMWFWGLEFTSPITDRTGCASGPPCYASSNIRDAINAYAPGVKFINNIIHDARMGIAMWKEAVNGEAYGNIIYNNGFHASDRGHGHGIYSQNRDGVQKFAENILFNGLGYNLHMYGSENTYVKNYLFEGNVSFNAGILEGNDARSSNIIIAGGADGNRGIVLRDNHFYNSPHQYGYNEIGWQWSGTNGDMEATNNYFIGGRDTVGVFAYQSAVFTGNTVLSPSNQVWLKAPWGTSSYNWNNNRYFGNGTFRYGTSATNFANWKTASKVDSNSTHSTSEPTGVWTFVRPNRCEAGRGHIIIYNWDLKPSVSVNLSSVLTSGMRYEIRDAQNFFAGPIISGTYTGGEVSIRMTGLTIQRPNGSVPYIPPHTAPKFGTFVILVPGSSSRTC